MSSVVDVVADNKVCQMNSKTASFDVHRQRSAEDYPIFYIIGRLRLISYLKHFTIIHVHRLSHSLINMIICHNEGIVNILDTKR